METQSKILIINVGNVLLNCTSFLSYLVVTQLAALW